MKNIVAIILLNFAFMSCTTLKVKDQDTLRNTRLLYIEKEYPLTINPELQVRLDFAVRKTIAKFNSETHLYTASLTNTSRDNVLKIDFTKAKLVSSNHKKTAYIINAIGMVAVPIFSMAVGATSPVMVNYIPKHKINSTITLQSFNNPENKQSKHLNSRAWVLFANSDKKSNVLMEKFSDKLYKELVNIDNQL